MNFECLAAVPNLRVALAHFGWPWCDELVALYGKFIYLNRNGDGKFTAQLFLDSTPGASGIYREDTIKKFFFCCVGPTSPLRTISLNFKAIFMRPMAS